MATPPCASCPWKKSTKTRDIPGGGMKKTCFSAMDSQFSAMGCHLNPEKPANPCAGFMVKVGFDSIGVRIATMRTKGEIHPDNYNDGDEELYDTMDEMLAAHHQGVK